MSFRGSPYVASPMMHPGAPSPFLAPQGGSMGAQAPPMMAYAPFPAQPMTAPTMGGQYPIMGHPPMGHYPMASTSPNAGTPTLRAQPQLIRQSPGPQAPPVAQMQRPYGEAQPRSAMPVMSSPGLQAMMGSGPPAMMSQYGSVSPAYGPFSGSQPPAMPPMQQQAMQMQMQRSPPNPGNLQRSPSASSARMAPSPRMQPQMQIAYAQQQPPRSQGSKWQVARAALIGGKQSGSLGSLVLHHQGQPAPASASKSKIPASPPIGKQSAPAANKVARPGSGKQEEDPVSMFQTKERGKAQRSAPAPTTQAQTSDDSSGASKFSIVGEGSSLSVKDSGALWSQDNKSQQGGDAWDSSTSIGDTVNWRGDDWGRTPFDLETAATTGCDASAEKENMKGYGIAFVGRRDSYEQAYNSRNILQPLYNTNGSRYSIMSTASVLGSWSHSSSLSTLNGATVGDLWGFDGASQQWRRRRFTLKRGQMQYDKGNEDRQILGSIVLVSTSVVESCLRLERFGNCSRMFLKEISFSKIYKEDYFDKPFCFTIETMAPEGGGVQTHLFAADNDRARQYWIDKLADSGCNVEAGEAMDNLTKFFFPMLYEEGAGRTKAKNFQDSWDSLAYGSSHSSARFTRAPVYNPSLRASTGSIFGI